MQRQHSKEKTQGKSEINDNDNCDTEGGEQNNCLNKVLFFASLKTRREKFLLALLCAGDISRKAELRSK